MRSAKRTLRGGPILLIAAVLAAGCAGTQQSAAPAVTGPITVTGPSGTGPIRSSVGDQHPPTTTSSPIAGDGQRGGHAVGATSPSLPADWPPDLPTPEGILTGATGSTGHWTAQFLMPGSAADVRQATADLFTAAGFTAVTDSVLNKGSEHITLAVENRDHTATETTLIIQVASG